MSTLPGPHYAPSQAAALRLQHARILKAGAPLLAARYGQVQAQAIAAEAAAEFEQLIPEIPYIGGRRNPFTDTLEQLTSLLALYRALRRRGEHVEVIGELSYQISAVVVRRVPGWLRRLLGRLYLSRFWRERTRRRAALSRQRRHPEDFVYQVVDDAGGEFVWGVDYLECGIVKYFQRQGASDFAPHMCRIDHLMFPAMGIDLQRQGTLAQGCARCDFRFRRMRPAAGGEHA